MEEMIANLRGSLYLASIGRLAFTISALEWLVLGDPPRHETRLPAGLTATALAKKTTGAIAKCIRKASQDVDGAQLREWLSVSADCLELSSG
jgi:hypothetical protein